MVIFSPYIVTQGVQFHRVHASPSYPSRIYFNVWNRARGGAEIRILGFEKTFDDAQRQEEEASQGCPQSLILSSPLPYT